MKKVYSLIILCLVLVSLFFTSLISCNDNEKEKQAKAVNEDSATKLLERGKYLANYVSMCMDCHSQRDFNHFSGPLVAGTEGMGGEIFDKNMDVPGVIYAKNITSDPVNGIGSWTDAEIERAIVKGIRKNGDTLFPLMPYTNFSKMAADDIRSIVAYIRTLPPHSNQVPDRKLFIPISMAYPPMPADLPQTPKPDVSDMVKYGEYVANSAVCMDCHTPMEKGQFVREKYMAGGYLFKMPGYTVNSANITPDSTSGIGSWTEEMFLEKFKMYRDPEMVKTKPGRNNTIMPWTRYAHMDDFDIKAIYRYLRTIPPVKNTVVKYPEN